MPFITVEAGSLTKDQKVSLAKNLTKTAAEVMKLPEDAFIVFMKENSYDNIAAGGVLLSERKEQ